jgi:hypothetical protein
MQNLFRLQKELRDQFNSALSQAQSKKNNNENNGCFSDLLTGNTSTMIVYQLAHRQWTESASYVVD